MRVLDNIWAKTSPYLSWTFATVAFQRSISKSSMLFCEPQVEAKNWRKKSQIRKLVFKIFWNRYHFCFQYLMMLRCYTHNVRLNISIKVWEPESCYRRTKLWTLPFLCLWVWKWFSFYLYIKYIQYKSYSGLLFYYNKSNRN